MIEYYFCHGFGFSPIYWKNFVHLLTEGKANFINLGYFKVGNAIHQADSLTANNQNKTFKIAIGHSLGFMKLISSSINFDLLIGINAFNDFLGDGELYKQRQIEHTQLVNNFNLNPVRTLTKFYRRCGLKEPMDDLTNINIVNLLGDLKSFLNKVTLPQNTPILIINTTDDIIVPHALNLINFLNHNNLTLKLLTNGAHGIVLNNAEETAKLINDFTKNYV